MRSGFAVEDIFKMRYFGEECKVVAGEAGMKKAVGWVHALEGHDLSTFSFHGQEFIFTTGIDFASGHTAIDFLKELISKNASGLCIETVLYYKEVEQEVIDLANEFDFPVIVSQKLLPLTEIIKDANSRILTSDGDYFKEGEQYYRSLLEMESHAAIKDYLQYTANYLGIQVAYWHILSEPIYSSAEMPAVGDLLSEEMLEKVDALSENEVYHEGHVAVAAIKVLTERYAYIVFYCDTEDINRYHRLILQRLASFLRTRVVSSFIRRIQKKHTVDAGWVSYWLQGKMSDFVIREKLKQYGITQEPEGCMVCCVQVPTKTKASMAYQQSYEFDYRILNDFCLQTTILLFRAFRDAGFISIEYIEENIIKYVVLAPHGMKKWKSQLKKATGNLQRKAEFLNEHDDARLAIGKFVTNISDLPKSHESALFCCGMECAGNRKIVYYDELYILRVIEYMKGQYLLDDFVFDHLGVLMEPENEELLHTLKTYYNCNCSKQQTAQELFIVRQTLYTRLHKLEEILGSGFDEGEKRMAIELAVRAIPYLTI